MAKLLEMPRRDDEPSDELNSEQRAAVHHGEGPLLVVAGAGTGKTKVITERIRRLLERHPDLPGEAILGLTFTDKAAAEMRHRVVSAAGERAAGVWLGTFHSFCWNLLSELNPSLQIIDEIDHWILLRRNMSRLELDQFKRLADPGHFLGDFTKFFSRCQDELVTPEDYQRHADALAAAFAREKDALDEGAQAERAAEVARQQEVARAYRASDALLRERNLCTYGALLLESVQLLRTNPALLAEQRRRYRYILVDEFQDTNIAQIELLALLAGRDRNVFAVGDDDQAIYRFRGASFGSFKLFIERFVGAASRAEAERHIRMLRRNYRSTRRILSVAGQSIKQNRDRYIPDKRLTTHNAPGDRVRIVELADAEQEAHWLAAELERLHTAGLAWSRAAVLYRAHAHRDLLVRELAARRIPFVIRRLSILESTIIRDLLAYLRLIAVPSDNVACARVLAMPFWRLAPEDLVRLCERAGRGRGLALWDTLGGAQDEPAFRHVAKRIAELRAWMEALRREAARLNAGELLDLLVANLGLALAAPEADKRYVARFVEFVRAWEGRSATRKLWELVEYLEYFREAGGMICLEEEPAEDAAQLMTVHTAKGLEFPHVFVMRLVRGAFPVWPRRRVLEFPEALMKEALPEGDFHVQEERRLFYVALTRAQERLTLTTIANRRTRPSVFIEDILIESRIKNEDVRQLAPRVEAAPPAPAEVPLFDAEESGLRAYSRIAEWAASYHPPVFEPLRLSASAIDSYRTCPQKYLLAHVWGVRGGPQAALTFGNVMHLTVREVVRGFKGKRRMPFQEVAGIYEREWKAAGYRDAFQEEEYRRAGLEQLEAFHAAYSAAPADVLHQEMFFELPLDPNIVVTGRIDQINRLGAEGVEIVDYKTGWPKLEKDAAKSLQLSLYALAVRDKLELDPERLTFYNLTTNAPVHATRDAEELAEARATVQDVAASIRAGHFPADPGFHCRSCEYHSLCPAHEQVVAIQPAHR